MNDLATKLIEEISTLDVGQGEKQEQKLTVYPFQQEIIEGISENPISAISMARANGKTTLMSGLAASAITPGRSLFTRMGEIHLVASAFSQARDTGFKFLKDFMQPRIDLDRKEWKEAGKKGNPWSVTDSTQSASIRHLESGSFLRVHGSDKGALHGLAPSVVLLDEPAQWRGGEESEKIFSAFSTALGKQEISKIILIGTMPEDEGHWFAQMILNDIPGVFSKLYRADPEVEDDFSEEQIRKANPMYDYLPRLREYIEMEAARAKLGGNALAAWRAYRLNLGTPELFGREKLVSPENWKAATVTKSELPPREGPVFLGVDLGGGNSMSGAACYWAETGRLEAYGCLPAEPSLRERGNQDNVGELYEKMKEDGHLFLWPGRGNNNSQFLLKILAMLEGEDIKEVLADTWRKEVTDQAMVSGMWNKPVDYRRCGSGPEGNQDITFFQLEVREGHMKCEPNLGMMNGIRKSYLRRDDNGNAGLKRETQNSKIDLVQAAILAVGAGRRWRMPLEHNSLGQFYQDMNSDIDAGKEPIVFV